MMNVPVVLAFSVQSGWHCWGGLVGLFWLPLKLTRFLCAESLLAARTCWPVVWACMSGEEAVVRVFKGLCSSSGVLGLVLVTSFGVDGSSASSGGSSSNSSLAPVSGGGVCNEVVSGDAVMPGVVVGVMVGGVAATC
jgi:hypothetical protein